jgi:hypothetical protein
MGLTPCTRFWWHSTYSAVETQELGRNTARLPENSVAPVRLLWLEWEGHSGRRPLHVWRHPPHLRSEGNR